MSGAVIKEGECEVMVLRTGSNTVFGKAIALIASVDKESNIQKLLRKLAYVIAFFGALFALV